MMLTREQAITATNGGRLLVVTPLSVLTDTVEDKRYWEDSETVIFTQYRQPLGDVAIAVSVPHQQAAILRLRIAGYQEICKHLNPNTQNTATLWFKRGTGEEVRSRMTVHRFVHSTPGAWKLSRRGLPGYCGGTIRVLYTHSELHLAACARSSYLSLIQTNLAPRVTEKMLEHGFVEIATFPDWKLWRSTRNVR